MLVAAYVAIFYSMLVSLSLSLHNKFATPPPPCMYCTWMYVQQISNLIILGWITCAQAIHFSCKPVFMFRGRSGVSHASWEDGLRSTLADFFHKITLRRLKERQILYANRPPKNLGIRVIFVRSGLKL
jgi:hypothetical protein